MKNILLSLFVVVFSFTTFSQEKLTLEQAVLGQYAQFYPTHAFDFNWIDDEGSYAYLDFYRTLVIGKVGEEESTRIDISEVSEKLDGKFFYFAGITWRNKDVFLLNYQNFIATYNLKTKEGSLIELPEDADNITFDKQKNNVAYTVENNLFYSPVDEFVENAVTSFDDKNIVSGQSVSRSEMGIDGGIFWSPKGNGLAFYQKDESLVHDYPILDNAAYPGELKSIKYPMAGNDSERVKVGIYSLDSKSVKYITPENGEDYYLTNLSWTPDEKFLILAEVARSQKHIWVQKYKADGTLIKTLFEESADTWVEPERPAYFPNEDSNDFVWVTEKDGFDNLYYYTEDGVLKSQLTKNKFPLLDIVVAQKGEIYFTATGPNPLNTMLYRVDTKGKQTLLTKIEGTHDAVVNCNGAYIFDQYSSNSVANYAQVINDKGKSLVTIIEAEDKLANFDLGKSEIKKIKNKEGTELYTRMIKPHDFDPKKKYPVLIYVYGGPHAQLIKNRWLDGASLWKYWMANQGYIVFTLDNRGSANRGAEFEHIIHRQLGVVEFEDQMVGVNYLKSLPYIDGDRIAVNGWSYGGFMTGTMMLKAPDVFKVGVAGGAVTDWKYYEIMYGERYMDAPQDNPEGYEKTSLINQAEALEGKLLMIHGTADPIVVMQHSLSLVQKFIELGKQMDYFPYPMHEHNVMGRDRLHLIEKTLNYILEYN